MGSSGYPFPPPLNLPLSSPDDEVLAAHLALPRTSSLVSPGAYRPTTPSAATPDDRSRDLSLLPSVMSPSVPPVAPQVPLGAMDVSQLPDVNVGHSSVFSQAVPSEILLPTPPKEKSRQLRLPSFDQLGIANPHPDNITPGVSRVVKDLIGVVAGLSSDSVGAASFGHVVPVERPRTAISASLPISGTPTRHISIPQTLPADIAILTPPEELPAFDWNLSKSPAPKTEQHERADIVPTAEDPQHAMEQPPPAPYVPTPDQSDNDDQDHWLDDALRQLEACVETSPLTSGHNVRVLSHALPTPSIPGHSFPKAIDSLRAKLPASPLTFINLLHAVPGRFNLSDLPTSPPSTPGQPLGSYNGTGEDYFTARVFESAITAADYASSESTIAASATEAIAPGTNQHQLLHFPLTAPSSLNLAIVERFIPPTSRNEFTNLFSSSKPSLLVDRLIELVPGNGRLLCIYPTKSGAETFTSKYLAPIIDPLLRAMVVVNNFSADLSSAIGRMSAVPHMLDFDTMKGKLDEMCRDLASTNPQVRQRLHGEPGNFSLVYAAKKNVALDRKVWADWYIKQEKTRIRNTVSLHFQQGNRFLADSETTPTQIIQEILGGVINRPYPQGLEPSEKIEVGVFVIKRGA